MDTSKIESANKQIRLVTKVSIVGNLVLFVIKFAVGIFTGSMALAYDSIHSLSDMITDITVLLGVYFGSKQPDEGHQYGHGRLETFSAGFIGIVGDDKEGQLLINDLKKVNVDTTQVWKKRHARTGAVLSLSDKQEKRSLYILPGANSELTLKQLNIKYINSAAILHITSFADNRQFNLVLDLLDKLDPHIRLSFSPGELWAARGLSNLASILKRTHILFVNHKELR